jgi:tetratricopeptide (TPR) repeat protein
VPAPGGNPRLATPVLGYREEAEDNNFFHTYKFVNRKLAVDTEKTFGLSDVPRLLVGAYDLTSEVWEKGWIEIEWKGLSERHKFSRTVRQELNGRPFARDMHWIVALDKSGMHADYYELTLRLRDLSGAVLDSKTANFTLSPIQNIPHPLETYKQVPVDNPYFFHYSLGQQCQASGDLQGAEAYFLKSIRANPGFAEGHVARLTAGNLLKKFQEVLDAAEALAKSDKFALDYHLIKGTALFGLERYDAALDELLAANKVYNSDIRVLNLLGHSFAKLGDMGEALKAFEASLRLNAKQPAIEKAVAEIKARLKK